MKRKLILTVLASGLIALTSQQAQAVSIRLTSGLGDSGIITDNVLLGQALFSGAVAAWNVNLTTATSKDILGSAASPMIDMTSFDSTTTGSATDLRILISDTGFTGSPLSFLADISSSANLGVTATFNTYAHAGNVLFGTGLGSTSLTGVSGMTGLFDSTLLSASQSFGAPYSLTLEIILRAPTGPSATSFDASLHGVPDGGTTVGLFGLALLAVAAMRRKFNA
jgi:hypothetical protein